MHTSVWRAQAAPTFAVFLLLLRQTSPTHNAAQSPLSTAALVSGNATKHCQSQM